MVRLAEAGQSEKHAYVPGRDSLVMLDGHEYESDIEDHSAPVRLDAAVGLVLFDAGEDADRGQMRIVIKENASEIEHQQELGDDSLVGVM